MGTRFLLLSGKEVIQVLLEFGAVVERASVDEAYVDLTRSETSSYLELILIIRLMTCQVAGCMAA